MKIIADKIALSGDWHGAGAWAYHQLWAFNRKGIKHVFQVGDFGLWRGSAGNKFLVQVQAACLEFDITLYVTLGNHEDYDLYEELQNSSLVDDEGIVWITPNIAILPRPFLFEIGNKKVASLGGAPSIDKDWRTPHVDWWPQEMFTEEMLTTARGYGKVDIVIAHDAPSRGSKAVEDIILYNPQGWNREALNYAAEGRYRMDEAIVALEPSLWFHGHYHVADQGYGHNGCVVSSLHMNGCNKANMILDIQSMEPQWV